MNNESRIHKISSPEHFDNRVRKFIQNPRRILKGHVKEKMTVLDLGCGPGLFTFEMAKMVGPDGKVIAADIQQKMLDSLREKIKGLEIEKRIKLHKSEKNRFNLKNKFDFILVFYVVHEVKNKKGFLKGIKKLMKRNSKILVVEPIFHVSKNAFEETLANAEDAGFKITKRPKIVMSRAALLEL